MPELPEVETVRRGLDSTIVGRRALSVTVGRQRVVRRTSAGALVAGLTGRRVESVRRHGKLLLLGLDSGVGVMIHLRMSGQVLVVDGGSVPPAHTHVDVALDDGRRLLFVDPRTFGEVVAYDPANIVREVPELAAAGPDPLVDGVDRRDLARRLAATRRPLKVALLDQRVIAGIGNIYADEICHRARLRPTRPASAVPTAGVRRLAAAIVEVLDEAVAAGGSTLGDAQYVGVDGTSGTYQEHHRVYGRDGSICASCGRGRVRRVVLAQRGTHFCPVCQR
ncbi:MAG: formamidopyrimidine-DNA glycosylase/DNA-(apurinic or apyrimidinic site) lyase [Actinomycetota bacterium]|jgi:formamidopyrimidine-DNA glycosylase